MVGHLGTAPSVSSSQARRISFFLVPEETCARDRTCTGFLVCERDATRLLRLRGLEKLADAAGATPARSCSTGRQTCCCYSRPKLADHRRMGMRGGDCRRQPVRALLAGARASTRRARLMAHSRHPAGCAAHSLSRFARLSGSSSKMAAPDGFAPSSADSESAVLLLNDRASKSGEPGGSCNLTNVRLKVGCRSAVASGSKWSLRQDLHPHWPRSRRGASA